MSCYSDGRLKALRQLTYTIESKAQGAAGLVHIQKGWIEDWETPMPPLEEQGAIAEILSIWDDSITKAELLLAARTELKKGLMQQLLMGRTRFKEFVKSPKTTGTHFGPYPSDWELRRVGEFLKESRIVGSGGDVARKLSIKLYGNGIVARRGTRSGSEHTQYYRRSSGQFIYSKLDFLNGAFAVVPDGLTGYESTLDLPAFDVSADLDVEWFLCFVCRREFYRAQVGLAAGGRKAKRVNAPEFLHMRIPVPSLGEQKRIAAVLNVCDREIELLQKQLVALKEQKRGLMQKLLTGEIRVKV